MFINVTTRQQISIGLYSIGPYWYLLACTPHLEKWGVQIFFSLAPLAKFFLYPHFSKCGGTSNQISVGTYWTYWNLLSGCHINKHRQASYGIMNQGKIEQLSYGYFLVSWLNLAAICHTLYSARSDFRPLTSSRVCFEIMIALMIRLLTSRTSSLNTA